MSFRRHLLPVLTPVAGWLAASGAAVAVGIMVANNARSDEQVLALFVLPDILLSFVFYPFGVLQLTFLSVVVDTQSRLFQVLGVVVVARRVADFLIGRKPLRIVLTPGLRLAALFVFVLGLSLSVADDPTLGLLSLRTFVQLLLLSFLIADYAAGRPERIGMFVAVAAGGLLNGGLGLYEAVGGVQRTVGLIDNPNRYGVTQLIVLAALLPLLPRIHSVLGRIGLAAMIATLAYTIVLSGSRGAAVAGLFTLGYYSLLLVKGFRRRGVALVGAVALLAGIVVLSPEAAIDRVTVLFEEGGGRDSSIGIRENYAQAGLRMGLDHFWTGVGHGQFDLLLPRYANLRRPPAGGAHNMYVQVFAETGIFGITVFGALIVTTVWVLRRTRRHLGDVDQPIAQSAELALVAWAVGGLFGTLEYMKLAWMMLGVAAAMSRIAEAPESDAWSAPRPIASRR
jgi:O-antigen ligase